MAIDIGAVAVEKARLIRMYASEMGDRDYAAAVLGLNRYRGMQHRVELAEAFHRCDAVAVPGADGLPRQLRLVSGAPGRYRTCNPCLRRAVLYPLSYGRSGVQILPAPPRRPAGRPGGAAL